MSRIAFLFPGQGAQTVGMGKRLAESLPSVRRMYDRAADVLEEAFNKWPGLRTEYQDQLQLWRRGISM